MVNFSGAFNEYIFGCWVGFAPIFRISHECLGVQWGIILGANPAEHCFVLRDLVPMSFFKKAMIVLLKMHASAEYLINLSKSYENLFFYYVISDQGTRGLVPLVGVIFNRRRKFKLFDLQGDSTPKFFFLVGHPDLTIRKLQRRLLDLLTVVILKRVSESIFFQINNFTASLKIKKR